MGLKVQRLSSILFILKLEFISLDGNSQINYNYKFYLIRNNHQFIYNWVDKKYVKIKLKKIKANLMHANKRKNLMRMHVSIT